MLYRGPFPLILLLLGKTKGKGTHEPKAQSAGAYPGFLSMKHLGVLLLPPGRDASPSQVTPISMSLVPLIHQGEERQSGVKHPARVAQKMDSSML